MKQCQYRYHTGQICGQPENYHGHGYGVVGELPGGHGFVAPNDDDEGETSADQ